ncbi:MAG: HAD-IC family P-type ATPase, partial [Alphaproteobacteria bacterium]
AVKGAPEAVLQHVTKVDQADDAAVFDHATMQRWYETCDLLAARGLRLLAIAGKTVTTAAAAPYGGLTLYGIVALRDPPRSDVATALGDARRAGIQVVMVTGDHARTAKSISDAVRLAPADAEVIEGADLKPLADMTASERDAARRARLFSRVAPEQKLDLVTLHQQEGEVVAMTGDGVNDAPALKKAEIGIAMGRRGTQVAREAADMVLADDAFSTIVLAIREGRIIYTNIRRFTTYLLSCNLSEILVIGLAVAAGAPLPLLPLQILFLNLVTDVFPALALGTIEADNDVLARAPRNPREPILTARQWRSIVIHGLTISVVTLAALAAAVAFSLSGDEITTMCFFTLALAQLLHVFNMRNWREGFLVNQLTRNRYVWLALLICLIILAAAILEPHLGEVLHIAPLPGKAWVTIVALSCVPLVLRQLAAVVVRLRRRSAG